MFKSLVRLFAVLLPVVIAAPVLASTVVVASCPSVDAVGGCLFNGNINSNPSLMQVNGYKYAENQYNIHAASAAGMATNAFGPITLNYLGETGPGAQSGTFTNAAWVIDYYAVKASNSFRLYKLAAPASTVNWNTLGIGNGRHDLSHLTLFGQLGQSPVPEPATWAMIIAGFGIVGGAMRRRYQVAPSIA